MHGKPCAPQPLKPIVDFERGPTTDGGRGLAALEASGGEVFGRADGCEGSLRAGSPSSTATPSPGPERSDVWSSPDAAGDTRGTRSRRVGVAAGPRAAGRREARDDKVFVGGVTQDMTKDALHHVFSQFGAVKRAWLQCHRAEAKTAQTRHRSHRGFGFVIFSSPATVTALLGDASSRFISLSDGRRLEVKRAMTSKDLAMLTAPAMPTPPLRPVPHKAPERFGAGGPAGAAAAAAVVTPPVEVGPPFAKLEAPPAVVFQAPQTYEYWNRSSMQMQAVWMPHPVPMPPMQQYCADPQPQPIVLDESMSCSGAFYGGYMYEPAYSYHTGYSYDHACSNMRLGVQMVQTLQPQHHHQEVAQHGAQMAYKVLQALQISQSPGDPHAR